MIPDKKYITIKDNLPQIRRFLEEILIAPKKKLEYWAEITNQTPAAKIGYIGQHLASLITGVKGTGSGARGDDLADKTEVKSCNKTDQADKCKNCGARVLRIQDTCPQCGSNQIERKNDSKWLFSVRSEQELEQYLNLDRIFLLLMDYPGFKDNDFNDIRICSFEIYPKETRMKVFGELLKNHYYNIYRPKLEAKKKTNPMNLHPYSFQFYMCNPIKTFECTIKNLNGNKPKIIIDDNCYISPTMDRDNSIDPLAMPTCLLNNNEWQELMEKSNFSPSITQAEFLSLSKEEKQRFLPYLSEELRSHISLRPISSSTQTAHYQRS